MIITPTNMPYPPKIRTFPYEKHNTTVSWRHIEVAYDIWLLGISPYDSTSFESSPNQRSPSSSRGWLNYRRAS